MSISVITLALLAAIVSPASAQFGNWTEGQLSNDICYWMQPRAAIVRDIIYLDGGSLFWQPRMEDGSPQAPKDNGNPMGLILTYNLSVPFDTKSNLTALLLQNTLSKARGGSGNSNDPNYYDGALLANDAEIFFYGGAFLSNSAIYNAPEDDEVLSYQVYQYGPEKASWAPGFKNANLGKGVNSYIAYGGAVTAPSENKAWYFSGLTSPDHEVLFTNSPNSTHKAVNVSDTLIQLDMAQQLSEKWTNKTLPDGVKGRAQPEVVWVPVGEQGILVVLGGVTYPEWAGLGHKSADSDASEKESPAFMSTIDIYDIANDEWYSQPTENAPGARTRGCAVVASASDYSSFNIFYYGGFDGISPTKPFNDEVWALSLPSFTWTKINDGASLHARAGHKCFMPYPDQMMALGGYPSQPGTVPGCLDKGPVVMFNVSSGEWMDSYDPADYGSYGVHAKIQSQIGGDASGSATVTTPVPSGWATSGLSKVFETSYPKTKISSYYPYAKATSTERPNLPSNAPDSKKKGGSGLPKWVAPVIGVVLGLMFVTGCLVIFCLWRRRKIFSNRSSEAGTEDTGMRIISWMRGQQQVDKAPTVTTSEESAKSPEMEESRIAGDVTPSGAGTSTPAPAPPAEMEDTQLVELADTSPPVELHDTGLSPLDIIQKHSRFGVSQSSQAPSRSVTNPSYSSYSAGGDRASTVSRSTDLANSHVSPASPDSPNPSSSSPASPTPPSGRVVSDISGMSERDAAHLRQLSVGTVSLTSVPEDGKAGLQRQDSSTRGKEEMIISPQTAEETPSSDYISAKSTPTIPRKAVFKEEDVDGNKRK